MKKYKGHICSVYEVEEEGFLRGMTSWSPELVCEKEVEVINEKIKVENHQISDLERNT